MAEIAKGFEDSSVRKQLAGDLCAMLEAHDASVSEPFATYDLAEDSYNDVEVMSSLDFIEDCDPYNMPLLKIRVNGLVQNVCGGFTGTSPYLIVKNGKSEDDRESAEKDLQYAWELAKFDLKSRQMGKEAAIRARGPVRVTFQEIKPGDSNSGQSTADGPLSYVGLVFDPIPAERSVFYPTNVGDIQNCTLVGHWFEEIVDAVIDKQIDGEYIDDWNPLGMDDSGLTDKGNTPTITSKPGHKSLKNYSLYIKMRPPQEESESEMEDAKPVNRQPRRWYEVVLCRTSQEILKIEEYEDPWPPLFAPCFDDDIEEIWPVHSVASSLLELQAIMNDQAALGIFGSAQAAFLTVLASNFVTDAQTVKLGIGKLLGFKGDPKFTALPNNFNASNIEGIVRMVERYADGLSQHSQISQGQAPPKNTTATEIEALIGSTIVGTQAQRVYFSDEIVRMGQFSLYLLAKHFKTWKRFHGKSLKASKAKSYSDHYSLEINGKAQANTSQAVVSKIRILIEALEKLKVPVKPPSQPLNVDALMEILFGALDFNVSTNKLWPTTHEQKPEIPNPEDLGVPPFPVADYLPSDIPPQLLEAILAEQQMGLPPEVLAGAPGDGAIYVGDPGAGPGQDGIPPGAY